MLKVITVCEGEFCEIVEFPTVAEMDAYSQGFMDGASNYGSGGCGVYTLDDLSELAADSDPDSETGRYHAEIAALIIEHLGGG